MRKTLNAHGIEGRVKHNEIMASLIDNILRLIRFKSMQSYLVYRVCIHNCATKDVTTGVGMYMGAGGRGTFLSLAKDTRTEAQKQHMYRWTMHTSLGTIARRHTAHTSTHTANQRMDGRFLMPNTKFRYRYRFSLTLSFNLIY